MTHSPDYLERKGKCFGLEMLIGKLCTKSFFIVPLFSSRLNTCIISVLTLTSQTYTEYSNVFDVLDDCHFFCLVSGSSGLERLGPGFLASRWPQDRHGGHVILWCFAGKKALCRAGELCASQKSWKPGSCTVLRSPQCLPGSLNTCSINSF